MAAYFQLARKNASDEPVPFNTIDEEMCAHFGAPVDERRYYREWYNIQGFALACGHSWDKIRELYPDDVAVTDWLEANFVSDAWFGR